MARATVSVIVKDRKRRVWHDSKREHIAGQLVISSGDYASEVAVGDELLVSGEHRDITVITDNLNLTVGTAFSNNANDLAPKRFKTSDLVPLTGTIDVTASATVNGVGTKFLSEIKVGDWLSIGTDLVGETRRVISITSDLILTVDAAFTDLANDTSPKKVPEAAMYFLTGSIDPAAAAAVVGVNTLFLGYGIPFSMVIPGIPAGKVVSFNARSRGGFTFNYVKRPTRQQITGSVDTAASVIVPGVGTLFTKELIPGDEIFILNEQRIVVSIESDISLTVNRAFTNQANDLIPEKIVQSELLTDANLAIFTAMGTQLTTTAVPAANVDDLIEFDAILALV